MAFCIPFSWRITVRRATISPNDDFPTETPQNQLPFTASVLGKLPAQVLLHVISYFATGARDRFLITSVCSHLRTLAVFEPTLWNNIDLRHPHGVWWAKLCYQRSGSAPLRVSLRWPNGHWNMPLVEEFAHDVLQRMETLHFETGHDHDPSVVPVFSTKSTPCLRTLVGRGPEYACHSHRFDVNTWSPILNGTNTQLTNLVLHGGDIQEFPLLPALKRLELTLSRLSAKPLLQLLRASDLLEILILSDVVFWEGLAQGIANLNDGFRLSLPNMHTLRIVSCGQIVTSLLSILPDPSKTFEVCTRTEPLWWKRQTGSNYTTCYTPLSEAAPIITRLTDFWSTKSGENTLPKGQIITNVMSSDTDRHDLVSFGAARSNNETSPRAKTSVYFTFDGQLDWPLPFSDSIRTMQIRFVSPTPFASIFVTSQSHASECALPKHQWRLLTSVDRLVITGAGKLTREDEKEQVTEMFARREEEAVRPLAVDFNYCDDSLCSFGEELVEVGLWSETRWNHR